MNAVILTVGNELTSGQTIDRNSAYLAGKLAEKGIETVEHRTLRDRQGEIAAAVVQAARCAEVVLITGGLGPTGDDLTRQALAEAMGSELVLHEPSLAEIEAFYRARGRAVDEVNRVQAMVPAGAEALANPIGTAPGIRARIGDAEVYVFPGVPAEMRRLYDDHAAPRLSAGGQVVLHALLNTCGWPESDVAAALADLMADRAGNPLVGTTAAAGMIGVRITARGPSRPAAEALIDEAVGEVRRRLGERVVGRCELPAAVGELLSETGGTLALAESCTGGLLGQLLTETPGASAYFLGGVIAYTNAAKQALLGVDEEALAAHGAVSPEVAEQLARGARQRFASDWAIGITGIAGPGGGTEQKPVGLVFTSLAGPEGQVTVRRNVFPGSRDLIRRRSALTAMDDLRLALLAAKS